jgi:uncharacterized membrane-anchored protein YhcB (DUF1043 family)
VEPAGYSAGIVLAIAIVAIVAGLILGLFMGRRTSGAARRYRDVALKLDQVMQDKKSYEAEVVEHFTKTAGLLNELTESYREVHNHLAQGADKLCNGSGPVSLERLENKRDGADIPAHLAHIQPPLDYAPKTSPDEKGMLNEEFGLERKALSEPPEKVH